MPNGEIDSIWKEMHRHSEEDLRNFTSLEGKLDKLLERQGKIGNKVDVFLNSYQDLKIQVEGADGEGGLKKKLNASKKWSGARLALSPYWSLFLGFLNR